jgi:hypothetical protein
MCEQQREDSDGSDNEDGFGDLFAVEDPLLAVFYFRSIVIHVRKGDEPTTASSSSCEVDFLFNFNRKVDLHCYLKFECPGNADKVIDEQLCNNILAIGKQS